ncbi:MAG: hypothetical protein IPL35_12645 [Sphingobacteriales bacterium]|nr:hypothetical protein [Sphingobacteriales bacterium]
MAALDIVEEPKRISLLFSGRRPRVFIREAEQEALSLSQQYPDAVSGAKRQWCRKAGAVWAARWAFEGKIGRVQNLQALDKEITQLKQEIKGYQTGTEQKITKSSLFAMLRKSHVTTPARTTQPPP